MSTFWPILEGKGHSFHKRIGSSRNQTPFQSIRRVNIGRRQVSNMVGSIFHLKDAQKDSSERPVFVVKLVYRPQTTASPQCPKRSHRLLRYLKREEKARFDIMLFVLIRALAEELDSLLRHVPIFVRE